MDAFMQKVRGGGKVTVVALGDSITELTWHTRGRLCWVGLLQEALFETYGRNRCWVINSGRCGDRAEGGLDRLADDVYRFAPDLVIVSYGMNDAGGGDAYLPTFRDCMLRLIREIRATTGADVLLRTPNPVFNQPVMAGMKDGQSASVEMAGMDQSLYAEAIVAIGRREGCVVVDHYGQWKQLEQLSGSVLEEPNHPWLYMSDSVHPGAQGHLAFFREMAPHFGVPTHFPWER